MAIIKCKMCGGDIELSADKTFGTCEYCGSVMTLPKIEDDQRAAAFNRGNHFRRMGEFDKALAVYERIVAEDNTDAEAHWCCALCRFGIEYVEDPTTYEWLPTCHRASFDSILEDVDYLAALEYSDGITRRQYQKDGAKIAEVQRAVLATSQKEEPFDVFICYKESDEDGNRTVDSTLAQDIYYQLTDKGYRVFFSRITLEDKVGSEYEPYIFAALNSAKVMIVVGTKPEHFSAVWVKNEWSRFLALMRKDRSKLLLPCYRDMDPYDLPEQLSVLQSYDMSKIGFIQDLIRGVSKVLEAEKEVPVAKETVIVQNEGGSNVEALLKRGQMALEDGEWERADDFFEQVLNQEPECSQAYWGKFLLDGRAKNARQYGEKVFGRILSQKRKKETVLTIDLVKIARDIDEVKEVLAFFTDSELARILSLEFNAKDYKYSDCLLYLEKEREKLTSSEGINAYLDTKLFSRLLQFADSNVRDDISTIYEVVLDSISLEIQEEKARIKDKRKVYSTEVETIKNQIAHRLCPIIESYPTTRSELEKEREIEEEKEEINYSKAIAAWRAAKKDYQLNHYKAIAKKRKIQDEIANLQLEARGLTGFFQGKKRRDLEEHISDLKELQKSIVVPEDPGRAPVKREITSEVLIASNASYIQFKEHVLFYLSPREKEAQEKLNQFLEKIKVAKPGMTIPFGLYHYSENGDVRPVEWIVLQVINNRYVWLLSKHSIDAILYSGSKNTSWGDSAIRHWLNNDFIEKTFNYKERDYIIDYDELPKIKKITTFLPLPKDKVYPLSARELSIYDYTVSPTPYVRKKLGAFSKWYWLRSTALSAAGGIEPQCVTEEKVTTTYPDVSLGVRPTLWVRVPNIDPT